MCREIVALRARGALRISHFIHLRAETCSETLAEELDEFGPDDRIGILSLMDHTPGERQFTDTTTLRTYLKGKYAMSDERDRRPHRLPAGAGRPPCRAASRGGHPPGARARRDPRQP